MSILILNQKAMAKAISMTEAILAVRQALSIYSGGERTIPLRTRLDIPEHRGELLLMPGYVPPANALGVKLVSVFPDNATRGLPSVPATMVLVDETTGQVSALLDGTWLTRLRTGAVAGLATDLLARPDAERFLLIGTGGQAESQLAAVLEVRPIQEVTVCGRDPERTARFARTMSLRFDREIRPGRDLAREAARADIITAVTTAHQPVFDGRLVKPGTHINGIGSYTPDMCEVPPEVVLGAGRIYVDTQDAVTEAGDFQSLLSSCRLTPERITGELGQLINGVTPGRQNPEEITFFKSTGNAILDLVTARVILDNALGLGLGQRVDL